MAYTVPVVAVINTSPDIIDMLRIAFEQAGFVVVSALTYEIRDGEIDVETFVRQHGPRVIVYDLAPPYDANWQFFLHMREIPVFEGCQFVLTSTNAQYVQKLAGRDQHVYEIIGKPFDLEQIIQAVKEALRARPTR